MNKTNKILVSAIMLVGNGVAQKLIGLVSTLILARILLPEDFAVVAIASLVILLAEVFTNTGSEQYVLSRTSASRKIVNSAWTLDLCIKLIATLCIFAMAYPVALFYEKPELVLVIVSLGVTPILTGLNNPGFWRLKRQQRYKWIVFSMVVSKISGVITTILLAIYTQSYWALIAGQVITSASLTAMSYWVCPYRPSLTTVAVRSQFKFSSFMIGQELFGYCKANIDSFFISKYYSNSIFGHFHIMKYIAVIPSLNLMVPLSEPLLVEMSKKQYDDDTQCFKYTVTFIGLALISIPITIFMFIFSYEIISVLLGSNWLEYHHIFGYMGLLVTSFFMATHCKRALMVKTKTNYVFAYELVAVLLVFFAVAINLQSDVSVLIKERVLIEVVAAIVFFAITTVYYLKHKSGHFLKKTTPLVVLSLVLLLASIGMRSFSLELIENDILRLGLNAFTFGLTYILLIFVGYMLYYKSIDEGKYLRQIVFNLIHRETND